MLLSQKDESGGNEEKIGKNQEKNREKNEKIIDEHRNLCYSE